jgi:hypothetical protein
MVANWIFPLAIVLSLPYESLKKRRVQKTFIAVLNWLGSPQTALTATIFNFRLIREANRLSSTSVDNSQTWTNLYYVVSSMNQFRIKQKDNDREIFFQTLLYALFHPIVSEPLGPDNSGEAVIMTKDLLSTVAHQLRMLRRRAVMPTMASLGTFLIAFVFSVVLSFAQVGDYTRVDPLVLGLLFSWLPVLVIFTIVDRNPVSSDRTA